MEGGWACAPGEPCSRAAPSSWCWPLVVRLVNQRRRGNSSTPRSFARVPSPAAQAALGDMHPSGEGALEDAAEAARWYRLAAEQGEPAGQYGLAYLYASGQGLPLDEDESARLMRLAAEQGPGGPGAVRRRAPLRQRPGCSAGRCGGGPLVRPRRRPGARAVAGALSRALYMEAPRGRAGSRGGRAVAAPRRRSRVTSSPKATWALSLRRGAGSAAGRCRGPALVPPRRRPGPRQIPGEHRCDGPGPVPHCAAVRDRAGGGAERRRGGALADPGGRQRVGRGAGRSRVHVPERPGRWPRDDAEAARWTSGGGPGLRPRHSATSRCCTATGERLRRIRRKPCGGIGWPPTRGSLSPSTTWAPCMGTGAAAGRTTRAPTSGSASPRHA